MTYITPCIGASGHWTIPEVRWNIAMVQVVLVQPPCPDHIDLFSFLRWACGVLQGEVCPTSQHPPSLPLSSSLTFYFIFPHILLLFCCLCQQGLDEASGMKDRKKNSCPCLDLVSYHGSQNLLQFVFCFAAGISDSNHRFRYRCHC